MDDANQRAEAARRGSPFLTTKQAAHYLKRSPRTLATMRHKGKGPPCSLHGGVWRYHIDDLERWANARRAGDGHD